MLFSFLYLAVGALFGLLIRCRRGPDVKDEHFVGCWRQEHPSGPSLAGDHGAQPARNRRAQDDESLFDEKQRSGREAVGELGNARFDLDCRTGPQEAECTISLRGGERAEEGPESV